MTLDVALSIPSITDAQDRHHLAQSLGYQTVDAMIEAALEVAAGARCETCAERDDAVAWYGQEQDETFCKRRDDLVIKTDCCRAWKPKP